jgi:hypothetical protein
MGHNTLERLGLSQRISRTRAAAELRIEAALLVANTISRYNAHGYSVGRDIDFNSQSA